MALGLVTWLGLVCGLVHCAAAGAPVLKVALSWKYLDWVWPSVPLTKSPFILGNAFSQDVDVDKYGRIFVTSPQWLEGVPITLSTVTTEVGPGGPLLKPYPNFRWHLPDSCDNLISIYRVAIDECNRLWAVDSGRAQGKAVCPAKILIFDLATDQLIHKYVIPQEQSLYGNASLVTPIVEVGKSCMEAHLYIADVDKNGLVIYDLQHDHSWRLNNTRGNAFGPDDDAMLITIAGETFDLTDGTLGMSLSPRGFYDTRYLYFNSLASYYQKFSDVKSLKASEFQEPLIFQSIYKRQSQAGVQATSKRGVIFFQLVQLTALACWNIERPFTPENVVTLVQDVDRLQYVSGIKVIQNLKGEEELWVNTNRLQKIINMNLTPTETNFRIIRGKVDDIIRGTRCEPAFYRKETPDMSAFRVV